MFQLNILTLVYRTTVQSYVSHGTISPMAGWAVSPRAGNNVSLSRYRGEERLRTKRRCDANCTASRTATVLFSTAASRATPGSKLAAPQTGFVRLP